MDASAGHRLPAHRRHLAVDERGVGLRITWHLDRGILNLSLWREDRCVETFHLTPAEAGRLVGFVATGLADAVPEPVRGPLLAVVAEPSSPASRPEHSARPSDRLGTLRCDLAEALERAADRLRR